MAQKIISTVAHVIVPPTATQNYHAVVHADSGREISRHPTLGEAMTDQARLNKLDAATAK